MTALFRTPAHLFLPVLWSLALLAAWLLESGYRQQAEALAQAAAGPAADLLTTAHRRALTWLAGATALLSLIVAVYVHFAVNRRLARISRSMAGFFRARPDPFPRSGGGDAVARLEWQFDAMAERLQRESRELAESRERLEFALNGSNTGIWDWQMESGHTYYSPRWKSLLGFADHELLAHAEEWLKRVHPDDLPRVMELLDAHTRGRSEFFESEHRLRRKDGSYFWVLERGQAIRDSEGKASRMVGAMLNIEAQKRAQEALARSDSERKTILDLSPDGFVFVDRAGKVVYVNPAFLAMTGLAAGNTVGLGLEMLEARVGALCDPNKPPPIFAAAPADQQQTLHLEQPEKTVLKWLIRSIATPQGGTQGSIMYFRDVTRESEIDRMKSEFLSTAAHELRTPMASIFGFSELLLAREFDAATQRDLIQTIHRQTRNLIDLVNELLDLARIEARGGKSFKIVAADLIPVVRDAVAAQYLPAETHRLEVDLPDDLPPVSLDVDKFGQCLANVLSNAVKYSPAGGDIQVAALRRRVRGKEQVGIAVCDPGIGMTPEQAARIFDRFYRADTSGAIPGTGLGMALVKEIMVILGGEVTVESAFGEGSEVTLWLPVAAAEATA